MPRKKAKSRMYFTQDTEDAIIAYNKSDDRLLKNDLYVAEIGKAFDKLAENLIHTFKFYYFDIPLTEVKNEVVSYLIMNIHKFKEGKGKAFSYFSIVGKNYLILHNNNNYKKMKQHDDYSVTDYKRNPTTEMRVRDNKEMQVEYIGILADYWRDNLTNVFKRKKDLDVANAVIELIDMKDRIDNFNKKALYILIREMTDSNTQHITRVINVMKKHHKTLKRNFELTGSVDTKFTGSYL